MAPDTTTAFRVVHLMTSLGSAGGGVSPAVRGLLLNERERGLSSIAIGGGPDDGWQMGEARPLQRYGGGLGLVRGLRDALDSVRPDLVSVHGLWQQVSVTARNWGNASGKPVVVHPHGMLDPWALRNSRWKKILAWWAYERRSLRSASCIRALCISEADSIRAVQKTGSLAVIPNGVELPHLDESLPSAPWSGSSIDGRRVMLFLGRIHPKKGIDVLFHGFKKARDAGLRDWGIAIAGWDDGGHQESLKRLATDLGMASDVVFLGPCFEERKTAALRNATVFILPSRSEGLPMAVLEAWAHSRPVVMSGACNLPDGYASGAALRCDVSDVGIASVLAEVDGMSGSDLAKMGGCGRHLSERDYSWDRIGSEMKMLYGWILGGGQRPQCVLS